MRHNENGKRTQSARVPRGRRNGTHAGTCLFSVESIPDPSDPEFLYLTHGNIMGLVGRTFEHLLRLLARMPSDSCGEYIDILFLPAREKQERLQLTLGVYAAERDTERALASLVERSPLKMLYGMRTVSKTKAPWKRFKAACDVRRSTHAVAPSLNRELNPQIPSNYLFADPLEADPENYYALLDNCLDQVDEPVLISLCVEPADTRRQQQALNRYRDCLAALERPDLPGFDKYRLVDYLGTGDSAFVPGGSMEAPLCRADPTSGFMLRAQRWLIEQFLESQLLFQIRIFARTPGIARLVASVVGECAFRKGRYELALCQKGENGFDALIDAARGHRVAVTHTPVHALAQDNPRLYGDLVRLPHLATVEELAGAFRLPVGGLGPPFCLRRNTDPVVDPDIPRILFGVDARNGDGLLGNPLASWHGIPLAALKKHMLITGMPQSGKTVADTNIVRQLWEHGIPFLVIEPVKTEMRMLKLLKQRDDPVMRGLGESLRVYSPGRGELCPLCIDPFSVQPGIPLEEHIEGFMDILPATMSQRPPMSAILREGLEDSHYCGNGADDALSFPGLESAALAALARKGYSSEIASDIRAALSVRIGDLCRGATGSVFRWGSCIPAIADLASGYSIIELDALPQEQACIAVLFLLKALREHIKTLPPAGGKPRLVILIDEAHLVVGRDTDAAPSETFANPKAYAAQYVSRLLCETSALGVGVIIIDQTPSAIAPAIVKMTGTKLAFLTRDGDDRETLGMTMVFGDYEMNEIARLRTGETFFITEGLHRPIKLRTPNTRGELGLDHVPSHEELQAILGEETWFVEARRKHAEAVLARVHRALDRLEGGITECIEETRTILRNTPSGTAASGGGASSRERAVRLCAIRRRLTEHVDEFARSPYARFLENGNTGIPKALESYRDTLRERWSATLRPTAQECVKVITSHH